MKDSIVIRKIEFIEITMLVLQTLIEKWSFKTDTSLQTLSTPENTTKLGIIHLSEKSTQITQETCRRRVIGLYRPKLTWALITPLLRNKWDRELMVMSHSSVDKSKAKAPSLTQIQPSKCHDIDNQLEIHLRSKLTREKLLTSTTTRRDSKS